MNDNKPTYEELAAQVAELKREADELRMRDIAGRGAGRSLKRISMRLDSHAAESSVFSRIAELSSGHLSDRTTEEEFWAELVELIQAGSSRPEMTCAMIIVGENKRASSNFRETNLMESAEIRCMNEAAGEVRIYSLERAPVGVYTHSFIGEDKALIETAAGWLGRIMEMREVEEAIGRTGLERIEGVFCGMRGICALEGMKIICANSRFAELAGKTPTELAGLSFEDIVCDADRAKVNNRFARHTAGDKPLQIFEAAVSRPGGGALTVEICLSRISVGGRALNLVLAADTADLDVSDEASRFAMDEHQRNELELTALLECSSAALEYQEFKDAAESILLSCMKATRSRGGYITLYDESGEESLIARQGGIYPAHEGETPGWLKELPELMCGAGGAVFVNNIEPKDRAAGGYSCFLMAGIMIRGKTVGAVALAGKPGGYTERNAKTVTAFADLAAVSYRNALATEALKNSEQFFRSVTETANDAIITSDDKGRITFWNRAAERIFGYTADEMAGRTYFNLVPVPMRPKHEDIYRSSPPKEDIPALMHPVEAEGCRRDGSVFPVEITLSRRETEGRLHFMATIRDITRRKAVEDELLKARDELEQRVLDRTAELAQLNAQLREEIQRYEAAQTALVESEARYSMLFENTPDGILVVDSEKMRYMYANPAMCKMLGYTLEEVLEKRIGDFAPGGASEQFVEMFKTYSSEPSAFIPELAMRRKDGTIFFVDLHTAGTVFEGRKVGIGFFRDVTERWAAQRAIRESEERYRTLAEAAQDFIFIVDYDGFLHYVNSYGAAQFRRRPQDIIGMRISELFPAGTWEHQIENIQKVVHTGEPLYVENTAEFEGRERWLGAHLVPMRNQLDEVTTVLGISRDITERKQSEQTLRESEERFRRISENSPDMILRWTIGRGVEYISRAVEAITGFKPDEVIDNMGFFASRIHPEDLPSFISALNGAAVPQSGNKTTQIEYRIMHRNGSWVWVESRVIPTREPDSEKIAFIEAITRDITERKRAEEDKAAMQRQLIQAQKMEAMGTLAGGMAHDFNNILSIIIGTSEIGLRKYSPEEPCYDRFKKILKASERAKDLTLKLLTFAKKEKLNIQTATVESIIEDVVDMIRRTLVVKVRIETDMTKCRSNINADVNQIHQAFLNICINAVDAMPEGGVLRIEAEEVTGCPAKSAAGDGDDAKYCRVRITDTGIGIPEDVIERVFDPFFTTRNAGTGLGLSVTLGIINNHGGHIAVNSAPGKGTTFDVYLPSAGEGAPTRGADADRHHIEMFSGSGSVLIIDDNSEFTEVVKEALTMAGFNVKTACDGIEALSVYEKSHNRIDIVLLDMIMAETDGTEMFHALRRVNPEARIIICSGHSVDGKASELLNSGAISFIQKPCSMSELFEKIVYALGM